jgi:hypothetical protein
MTKELTQLITLIISSVVFSGCAGTVYKTNVGPVAVARRFEECKPENYVRKPARVWKQFPLVFYIDKSVPKEAAGAIKRAGESWNQSVGFTLLKFSNIKSKSPSPRDGHNVIYWDRIKPTKNTGGLAFTQTAWLELFYIEADIYIFAKGRGISFLGEPKHSYDPDLESIMVHEFGHVFGLEHVSTGVMVSISPLSVNERRIDANAIDAVRCLYKEQFNEINNEIKGNNNEK